MTRDFRYRWAELDDGKYAVFIERVTGDSAGLWQLVAQFADKGRAVWYAELEEAFSAEPEAYEREPQKEECAALPPTPALPHSGLAQIEAGRLSFTPPPRLSLHPIERFPEPLSDRVCERPGCGKLIPERRASRNKTKYCSQDCADILAKERYIARQAAGAQIGDPADLPPALKAELSKPLQAAIETTARTAELQAIERHMSEKGVTVLPPAYAAPTTH